MLDKLHVDVSAGLLAHRNVDLKAMAVSKLVEVGQLGKVDLQQETVLAGVDVDVRAAVDRVDALGWDPIQLDQREG